MSAIEYVKTLRLSDDDVVVMRVLSTPTVATLEALRNQLQEALDGKRVLIMGEALEVDAIKPSSVEVLKRTLTRWTEVGSLTPDERLELLALLEALEPDDPDRHDQPF